MSKLGISKWGGGFRVNLKSFDEKLLIPIPPTQIHLEWLDFNWTLFVEEARKKKHSNACPGHMTCFANYSTNKAR